jgi:hypothetical protein
MSFFKNNIKYIGFWCVQGQKISGGNAYILTVLTWRSEKVTTNGLKKMRLKGKDFKKGGEALRGKNVIEAYRVKDKEIKRTMK